MQRIGTIVQEGRAETAPQLAELNSPTATGTKQHTTQHYRRGAAADCKQTSAAPSKWPLTISTRHDSYFATDNARRLNEDIFNGGSTYPKTSTATSRHDIHLEREGRSGAETSKRATIQDAESLAHCVNYH